MLTSKKPWVTKLKPDQEPQFVTDTRTATIRGTRRGPERQALLRAEGWTSTR